MSDQQQQQHEQAQAKIQHEYPFTVNGEDVVFKMKSKLTLRIKAWYRKVLNAFLREEGDRVPNPSLTDIIDYILMDENRTLTALLTGYNGPFAKINFWDDVEPEVVEVMITSFFAVFLMPKSSKPTTAESPQSASPSPTPSEETSVSSPAITATGTTTTTSSSSTPSADPPPSSTT